MHFTPAQLVGGSGRTACSRGRGVCQQNWEHMETPSGDVQKYRTCYTGAGGLVARTSDICVGVNGSPLTQRLVRTGEISFTDIQLAKLLEC